MKELSCGFKSLHSSCFQKVADESFTTTQRNDESTHSKRHSDDLCELRHAYKILPTKFHLITHDGKKKNCAVSLGDGEWGMSVCGRVKNVVRAVRVVRER